VKASETPAIKKFTSQPAMPAIPEIKRHPEIEPHTANCQDLKFDLKIHLKINPTLATVNAIMNI
jgi:hypothetical protein